MIKNITDYLFFNLEKKRLHNISDLDNMEVERTYYKRYTNKRGEAVATPYVVKWTRESEKRGRKQVYVSDETRDKIRAEFRNGITRNALTIKYTLPITAIKRIVADL